MKNIVYIVVFSMVIILASCSNERSRNYQFMPNMYESVGYEAYSEGALFVDNQSAKLPVEGTIPRGYSLYEYDDTLEDREAAKAALKNPLPVTEKNLAAGKELYGYFCSVCHGDKGDGKGILAQREKFLGIPSYADPGRVINDGAIYHVQMYGLNAMGAFTAQTTPKERWQIAMHVMNLKATLEGTPLLEPVSENDTETPLVEVQNEMSGSIIEQTENNSN